MYGIENRVNLPVGENLQEQLMISLNFGLTTEAQGTVLCSLYFYFLTRATHDHS